MSKQIGGGDNLAKTPLANLVQQFRVAPVATTADRTARDRLLDELQDAVGLSGQMTTEGDILRRATKLLQTS
jgi:hypothetical protein